MSSNHWNFRKLPSALDFQWIMAKTLPRYQWTASAGLFAGGIMERNALDNVKSFSAMVGVFTENDGEDWSGSLYFSWMNNSALSSELRLGKTTASFNGSLDIPFDGWRCDIAVNAGYEKTGSLFPIFIADKLVGTNGNWFAGMMKETYYNAIGMGVAATWHPQLKQ